MRLPPLPAALLATAALAIGLAAPLEAAGVSAPRTALPTISKCVKSVKTEVFAKGQLTVATNFPAIVPWFVNDTPSNEKGYEAAVAYKIASMLGFKAASVTWHAEPYELSETAGTKPFDFDINEITYNKRLTKYVAFSSSYYNVNQSLVTLKSDRVATHHSPSALRATRFGDVAGSPGLAFITSSIKPTHPPLVYASLADAIAGLSARKIQAIVVDTPSAQYLATQQIKDAVLVGQFHTHSEHYSLVLQKNSPLLACVNATLSSLSKTGKLASMSKRYLGIYNAIPFLRP